MNLTRRAALAGVASSLLATPGLSRAQAYPNKPIRLLHTSTPGSPLDILARILGEAMTAELGQSVIVESKPGGNSTIAAYDLLAAAPDGYTILAANEGLITETPHAVKVRYDPLKDFRLIGELGDARIALVVAASVPATTVNEFVAYVKSQRGGAFNSGSWNTGSLGHLAALQFAQATGTNLTYVPYKGSTPALQDVLGGHLMSAFVSELGLADYLPGGKIKCLAITGTGRAPLLPNVPTFAEAGLPSLNHVVRLSLFTRPDVNPEVRAKLRGVVESLAKQPGTVQRMAAAGFWPVPPRSEAEMAQRLREISKRNGDALRAAGIQPE